MTEDELLFHLKDEIGIPDLRFNDEGVLRLVSDNDLIIDLEVADGRLYIYIPVGRLIDLDLTMARMLLSGNLFVRGSCGAVVALDEDFGEILLNRYFDMEALEISQLIRDLETMMSKALEWRERLSGWNPEDEGKNTQAELGASPHPQIKV